MSANPGTPIEFLRERCILLKKAGASEQFINEFIIEYAIEFENELNELNEEGILGGIGKFFTGAAKGLGIGLEGIKSTLVEKLARYILKSLGFKEGHLRGVLVTFIGNQDLSDIYTLIKGTNQEICAQLGADLAQTLVEYILVHVVAKFIADEAQALKIDGVNIASVLRNMFFDSDTSSGFTGKLEEYLSKYICNIDYKKIISDIDLFEEIKNKNKVITESSFQKRMKIRLRKAHRVILDGGRKDLVKYGKPWNQPRQKYSNAFAANEGNAVASGAVAGYAGPMIDVKEETPSKKKKKKIKRKQK